MFQRSERGPKFRSRTPPRANGRPRVCPTGTCPICFEDLEETCVLSGWNCFKCTMVAHVRCMRECYGDGEGRIRLPNGCPTCRSTFQDAKKHYTTLVPAPHGARCCVCLRMVERGTSMMRCAAPKWHCIAVWHVSCGGALPRVQAQVHCRGCGLSLYDAINIRTRE